MAKLVIIALAIGVGLPAGAHAAPPTGKVTGTVVVKGRKDSAGVLVYLEGVPGPPTAPKDRAVIRQREKQFDPPVTIVVRGTTVDFPNDDKFFHNVFSVSRPARFDLGLYKSGTTKSVEMKHAGTVDVYCNIHPNMVAKVKVLDSAFYTVTDGKGRFQIAGVPSGRVAVVAWLPSGDQATGTVTVKAGEVVDVKLEVTATVRQESHLRKDGTPYGRYK
jgi:plastocyanin